MRPRWGMRTRLVLSLAAMIAAVQAFNAGAQYVAVRSSIVQRSGTELSRAATIFTGQIAEEGDRLAEAARILSLDYPLREAVATGEHATALSALRNYGQRIGGARMLLVSRDGIIQADTGSDGSLHPFPYFSALMAAGRRSVRAMAVLDDGPVQFAAVPVLAPLPIGWIVAAQPLDDAEAERLRSFSPVPIDVTLIWRDRGAWAVAGTTLPRDALPPVIADIDGLPDLAPVRRSNPEDAVLVRAGLDVAAGSADVVLLLRYRVSSALEAYEPLVFTLAGVILAGLGVGLVAGGLVARFAARPLAQLAAAAQKIEQGQYDLSGLSAAGDGTADGADGADEVGKAMAAFRNMAEAVSDRERQIRHLALHDGLTGLPNRIEFERRLGLDMEAAMGGGRDVAVALLNVERLAEINNALGHAVGDRLLVVVSRLLAGRAGTDAVVARVGDATFAISLPGDEDAAVIAADMLVGLFDAPVPVEAVTVDVLARAGVAGLPPGGAPPRELLRRADVALYRAQRSDQRVVAYRADDDPHRPEDLSLMGELRAGIDRGELHLRYQPKIALAGGTVVGVEALVRWIHPRHGFLPPDRFIPLAEETGNIRHLTRWALRTACAQQAAWTRQGITIGIAVNVSGRDLADPELPGLVAELLASSGRGLGGITIEVTESAVMHDIDAAAAMLRRLAEAGATISIDDFGTGHSSLSYLQRLPAKELKIDRSFVKTLTTDQTDQTVVRTVIGLGHALGMKVVAEGVETAETYALLADLGCDLAQGYHMSRPVVPEELPLIVETRPWLAAGRH